MGNCLWVGTDSGNEGDLSVAANWLPAAVPIAGDAMYFRESRQDITAGLAAFTGLTMGEVHFEQSFTGKINDGAGGYMEFGSAAIYIGEHEGAGSPGGSGQLLIDTEAVANVITIYNTGPSSDANNAALRILCNNAANVIHIRKGTLSIAKKFAEVAVFGTLNIGYDKNQSSDANVMLGAGVTATTILKTGSKLVTRAGATTLTNHAGDLITEGAAAFTTLNAFGGSITPNSSGTIATLAVKNKAIVDFTRSTVARTVTNASNNGGTIKHDDAIVTFTNKITSDLVQTLSV